LPIQLSSLSSRFPSHAPREFGAHRMASPPPCAILWETTTVSPSSDPMARGCVGPEMERTKSGHIDKVRLCRITKAFPETRALHEAAHY
jgi:hypothetical protein